MAENRDLQFQSLLADAQEDPDVLRVFVFGSAIDERKPDLEWLRGEAAYRG
jgi:hypothetical protein